MKEITPKHLMCGPGSCPSIFEVDQDNIVVVGKTLSAEMMEEIEYKIGKGEFAVLIKKEFFKELK